MAIKISGNTVIDDSQNITSTGSATISGRMLLGTTTEGQQNADNLTIADSGHCGLTIRSGTTSGGAIYFSDATSGGGEYEGYIEYNHPSRFMRFGTAQDEAMRLDSSGNLNIGGTLPSAPNISLNADGSATFNGETIVQGTGKFFLKRDDGGATTCAIRDDNLRIFDNPVSYDDYKISLENDGSATFAGGDAVINSYGQLVITRSDSNAFPSLTINSAGTTTNTIDLNGDGSASFAGEITAGDFFNTSVVGSLVSATGAVFARQQVGAGVLFQGLLGSTSTSSIRADGSATFAASVECNTELRLIRGSNRVNLGGSDTLAVFENNGNFAINWDGSASFDGTITADGGYALSQLTELT